MDVKTETDGALRSWSRELDAKARGPFDLG